MPGDPTVLAHARALLTSAPEGRTAYIHADLRDPARILADPQQRDSGDFARFAFPGLELVPPGVVLVSEWRPGNRPLLPDPSQVNVYCGVARKP
jgi:S-adenosyl methyltransferase